MSSTYFKSSKSIVLQRLKPLSFSVACATLLAPEAFAGAPSFSDARALAMGGVGVTAARPAAAGFFNPALLAVKQPDKRDSFGMLLPSVTAIASDEEELRDVIDDFEDDFVNPFENAIDELENALSSGDSARITQARLDLGARTDALNNKLVEIDRDQISADLGLGFSALVPSESYGAGLFGSGSARIAAQLEYRDAQLLSDVSALASTVTDIQDILDLYDPSIADEQLQSTVRAVGSAYSQVGVAISHNFRFDGHDYALGISPKMVDLRAYDFIGSVEDYETDDLEDTKVSESKFNFDLGVASFIDDTEQVLVGLSVINVLPMEITSQPDFDRTNLDPGTTIPDGIKIELKPKLTTGISYLGGSYELAADLELTKTEEVFGEGDTQYLGLGGEYDLADVFQLRAGMRYNLAESSDGVLLTGGFGLRVVGFTFELAALTSTDSNTVGIGAQLGATF